MQIAFRTDASLQIGTGHIMRCLTLAHALRERGSQSSFICRPHTGHLLDLIQKRGHRAITLAPADDEFSPPASPTHSLWLGTDWASDAEQSRQALGDQIVDWIIIDHYALDRRWEQALRPHTQRILAIDDLADRPHDCDLLLDQNLGRLAQDYKTLLSRSTQTLIGPAYALLRPEFAQWREVSLRRRVFPHLKNLLITMGGVDQTNATCQVLASLAECELPADLRITVVMGLTAPWLEHVKAQAAVMPRSTQVLAGVNNMAELLTDSDLCIGAAGSTSWERCCLGLPTIQLVLAANQKKINAELELSRSVMPVQLDNLKYELPRLIARLMCPDLLREMSKSAASVCDGQGVINTVRWLEKDFYENHASLQ